MSISVYPKVVLNAPWNHFPKLISLLRSVISAIDSNPHYPDLPVPLNVLQSSLSDLMKAHSVCGITGREGTQADYKKMCVIARKAHKMLLATAAYVQSIADLLEDDYSAMAAVIATSGFPIKQGKRQQGMVGSVQGITSVYSNTINRNQVDWRFKRPLEITSRGNVKIYRIYRSTENILHTASLVGTVTKGRFVDTNNSGSQKTWHYWFAAVTVAGEGRISDCYTVTLPGRN